MSGGVFALLVLLIVGVVSATPMDTDLAVQTYATSGCCYHNDHHRMFLSVPELDDVECTVELYGLFDGTEQDYEDLLFIMNGVSSVWEDPNTEDWDGWQRFTLAGTFPCSSGENSIEMKHPWYDDEMSDGYDDDYRGGSVHYGTIRFVPVDPEIPEFTTIGVLGALTLAGVAFFVLRRK